MGRAEERRSKKNQKKQFKKQGLSDKHYEDFMKKVDERYYNDIVITAFEDVYKVFYKELKKSMRDNKISEERAEKILLEAMNATRKHKFIYEKER